MSFKNLFPRITTTLSLFLLLSLSTGGSFKNFFISWNYIPPQALAQGVPPGDGLSATYFKNSNCTGTSKNQVDGNIDFSSDVPFGVGYHDPCIKWKGQIYIEGGTGDYTFYVTVDDTATIRVNNQKIYERTSCCSTEEPSSQIKLEEKKRYDFEVDFTDAAFSGYISVFYSGPGISKQIIPQRVLYSTTTKCSDHIDNDGDGKTDWPNDPGCKTTHDDKERDPACMDGIDNDGDTLIDFPNDPGCLDQHDEDEGNAALPACSDFIDNDGDGKIDYPNDPGCESPSDSSEQNPQCNDTIDNDGDGAIDFPADPGCSALDDTDEINPACNDGIDNDGDGKKDFPEDIGCDSLTDNDETNAPIDRNIILSLTKKPQIIFQTPLVTDEVLTLPSSCSTCTVTAIPDPTQITLGQEAISIITIHNSSDDTYSYAILIISNKTTEATKLFTRQGKAYSHIR